MVAARKLNNEILVADSPEYRLFWDEVDSGVWEPTTLNVLRKSFENGGIFIDIGAWIGPTTLLAAKFATKVISYEPDPVAATELRRNVELSGFGNIEINQVALFDRDGTLSFGGGAGGELGRSGSSLMSGLMSTTVETKDIRKLLSQEEWITCKVLKIDIEGAEYRLIGLLRSYLNLNHPRLLLSTHSRVIAGNKGFIGYFKILKSRIQMLILLRFYGNKFIEVRKNWLDASAYWERMRFKHILYFLIFLNRNFELFFCNDSYHLAENIIKMDDKVI